MKRIENKFNNIIESDYPNLRLLTFINKIGTISQE
jgi:hypothetical protein